MKKTTLKMTLVSMIMAATFQIANSQTSVAKVGYFMDNAPQKHFLNPALVPMRGYFNYPVLGSMDFDIRTTFGMNTFLYPGANPGDPLLLFMNEAVPTNEFLSKLSPDNYFKLNNRMSLFGLGFYAGTSFWTFDVSTRWNTSVNAPYDFFKFLKVGLPDNTDIHYNIQNLGISSELIAETSLGASFLIGENLRVGAKAKFLAGGAKLTAGMDQIKIDVEPNNYIFKVKSEGKMTAYLAGIELTEDDNGAISGFEMGTPGMAGMGFAADLGASYSIFKFLTVSAGITDLGVINWNKTYNKVAKSAGEISYNGIDDFMNQGGGSGSGSGSGSGDEETDITDQLMKVMQFKLQDEGENLSEKLIPTINVGAEAGIWNNRLSLGVLYSNKLIPNNSISELTAMVNIKPIHMLNVTGSYTLMNSVVGSVPSFGFGVGLNLLVANIFVACDYVPTHLTPQFIPIDPVNTNVQIGLSLALGKMKKKNKD
ncbi:DUF5723 family protein [Paludibacter sp.]